MSHPQVRTLPTRFRVFIPSYHRAERIVQHTWPLLKDAEPTVVVHTEEEAAAYRDAGIPEAALVVSRARTGVGGVNHQREFIFTKLLRPGEWAIYADDNIRALTAVPEPDYARAALPTQEGDGAKWRQLFATPCDVERLMAVVHDSVREATRVGARCAGFAVVDNPYFRSKKFRYVGYVIAKLNVLQQCAFTFDHTIKGMNDHRNSSEHLLQFGRVLINNYFFPVAPHYEPGGMGTYAEREPQRVKDIPRLLAMYPGLWRVKERPGEKGKLDLQMRFTSTAQVDKWRAQMLGLANAAALR